MNRRANRALRVARPLCVGRRVRDYAAHMELQGKRVLLSGATGGLGRAIAERLAGSGAKLVLSSRRETELAELAASLPGVSEAHQTLVADLTDPGAAEGLVAEAGDIDILVANAALPASGLLTDLSSSEVTRALRVNLEAPILMARELSPSLASKGEGHIVLMASLAGKVGSPRASLYNATKFGLRGFAFGLREDLHAEGVGVSVVSPGFVREAGMFHDSGSKEPPGLGPRPRPRSPTRSRPRSGETAWRSRWRPCGRARSASSPTATRASPARSSAEAAPTRSPARSPRARQTSAETTAHLRFRAGKLCPRA